MSRRVALQLASLAVVVAGLVACTVFGGWFTWVVPLCVGLVVLATTTHRHLPRLPWGPLTGVIALLGLGVPWSLGADLLEVLASSMMALQLARRWGRSGPGDDRASAMLALLMIVLAASTDPSITVGASALAWLAGIVPLGILSHLERHTPDRRRSVGIHLVATIGVVLCVTAIAFLGLPRFRQADLGAPTSDASAGRIGFHDEVNLGEVGSLLDDPTPVLRITQPHDMPPPTYLRGIVLDRFDGRGWLATFPDDEAPTAPPAGARPVRLQAEPAAGVVAFAPGPIVSVQSSAVSFQPDAAGNWRLQDPPQRLEYTAWVHPPAPDPGATERWTQLPPDLDPRIVALAEEILPGDPRPLTAAEAVSDWLDQEATYTWQPRDQAAEDPLSTFLFERRSGHCEYFSTAAAVLLRARGIPARVVNGYARPEYNAAGGYWLARQGHAHSWIEVRDRSGVWRRVDPTPGGSRPPAVSVWSTWSDTATAWWNGRVLSYDGATQVELLRTAGWFVQSRVTGRTPGDAMPWLGLLFLVGLGAAGFTAAIWLARRLGRRLAGETRISNEGRVARAHRRARTMLRRRGWHIPEALPPVEAARWVAADAQDLGACLEELAWLHYRVRFAGEDDSALIRDARQSLGRLRSLARQVPAPVDAQR